MMNCSYGNGLRLAANEAYKKVLVQSAESLCKRYNPNTQCIESWNYRKAWNDTVEWFFPVIVDNMMNLELLFEATQLSGNKNLRRLPFSMHITTMKNHYRPDYSSYHVVDYDTITGEFWIRPHVRDLPDESSWSRGQSWGLYGFVLCYRYTKDPQFLSFAENIANLPDEPPECARRWIPYWDYNAVDSGLVPEWKHDPGKFPADK